MSIMKSKKYPDLRYKFIRGLLVNEQFQRTRHYLKSAAEWTSRAIVSLDLAERPVKSAKQAAQLEGIGGEISKKLKDVQASSFYSAEPPKPGMHCSSAGAFLTALLIAKIQMCHDGQSQAEESFIPESMVVSLASAMCEETFLAPDCKGLCPALWRMTVLASRGFVKKRSLRKEAGYELLPPGERIARRLLAAHPDFQEDVQMASGEQRAEVEQLALYANDPGDDGVVLCVDIREWGGDGVGLAQLAQLLMEAGVHFRTSRLDVGDYAWVWRKGDQERMLPLLMERKRADDLARSLVDKRFDRQLARMRHWKETVTARGVEATVKYLLEGQPEDYVVACSNGCCSVLQCGFPTADECKVKIQELESGTDIGVLRSGNIEGTVQLLAAMTLDLHLRLEEGEFVFEKLVAFHPKPVKPTGVGQHQASPHGKKRSTAVVGGGAVAKRKKAAPKAVISSDCWREAEEELDNAGVGVSTVPAASVKEPPPSAALSPPKLGDAVQEEQLGIRVVETVTCHSQGKDMSSANPDSLFLECETNTRSVPQELGSNRKLKRQALRKRKVLKRKPPSLGDSPESSGMPSPCLGKVYVMKKKSGVVVGRPSPKKSEKRKVGLRAGSSTAPLREERSISESGAAVETASTNPLYGMKLTPPEFFNIGVADVDSEEEDSSGPSQRSVLSPLFQDSQGLPDADSQDLAVSPEFQVPNSFEGAMDRDHDRSSWSVDASGPKSVCQGLDQILPNAGEASGTSLSVKSFTSDGTPAVSDTKADYSHLGDHLEMVKSVLPDAAMSEIIAALKHHNLDVDLAVGKLLDDEKIAASRKEDHRLIDLTQSHY